MKGIADHPVLLVNPDRDEAEYLRCRLASDGVSRPIVTFADTVGARDYLSAATVANAIDHRYIPCAILLDEKLGQEEVRSFANWIRSQPLLTSTGIATLSDTISPGADGAARWGTDAMIATGGKLDDLAGLLSRSCE